MFNNFLRFLPFTLVVLFSTACSSEPRTYDFAVQVAGGPEGWPVWIEQVTFDDTWDTRAGSKEGGFDQKPPRGGIVVIDPKPAPQKVHARWFSYRTQTFYEAIFQLPDDLDDKLHRWYQKYPRKDYTHYLVVGFSGKGEALAWWKAFCSICEFDRSHDFNVPLTENITAKIVEGDPKHYEARTRQHVERGTIPQPSGVSLR